MQLWQYFATLQNDTACNMEKQFSAQISDFLLPAFAASPAIAASSSRALIQNAGIELAFPEYRVGCLNNLTEFLPSFSPATPSLHTQSYNIV